MREKRNGKLYTTLCFVIMSMLLLTGCSSNIFGQKPGTSITDNTTENEKGTLFIDIDPGECLDNTLCSEDEVEEDINSISLEEDQKLTEVAQENQDVENASIVTDDKVQELVIVDDLINVIREFDSSIPDSVVKNIKYSQYSVSNDYLLIMVSAANVRKTPDSTAQKIGTAHYFEKLTLVAEVKGQNVVKYNTDIWYEVLLNTDKGPLKGYILSSLAEIRTFQFSKMIDSINALKTDVDNNITAYIANYKNRNGTAPTYLGKTVDVFGTKRYQSAPAYEEANLQSKFRYIADGTLLSVIAETDTFYKIKTLNFAGEYYVPKKYVSLRESIDKLTKVIVVDRKNQNEGVFEYVDNKWNIISYIYATTGDDSKFKEPTSLGYYMAIQKVDRFLYLDDVTKKLQGYAPYGIRFNGGAYIHGVPVNLVVENGIQIFPPMVEYLFTIGTVPRSHKCVRNYTSHAKFLHEWTEVGKTAVIVIE
jgi:hypothetical protein